MIKCLTGINIGSVIQMSIFTRRHKQTACISAIADGKIIRLENISDQAFANQMVGDGIAIEINEPTIYAPCAGVVSMIVPTKHAFTIKADNDAEILVHIGLKHNLDERHFNYHVNVNETVNPDTAIVSLNDEAKEMLQQGLVVVIVVLNYQAHPIQTRTTAANVIRGKKLFMCR